MLHTFAYTDSTATAQTDSDIPVATDPSVTVLNGHILPPQPVWIQWLYALGLTVSRVRLTTPRIRPVLRPVISPVDQSATPTENLRLVEYWRSPIKLNAVEEVQFLRTNTTAVAERDFVVLTYGDNVRNIPPGDMYTGRGTTTITPVIGTWTSGVITLDDTLEVGQYSCVGLRVNNAGGVAARLIFPGPPLPGAPAQIRPGVLVAQSVATEEVYWQRYGMMGEYGRFEQVALPQLDINAATVTANPEVFLDVIPMRRGARLVT